MRRRCNTRIVIETAQAAGRPMPHAVKLSLLEARRAANTGQCALMHKYAQHARAVLNLAGR